ncbi:MAG: cyclic nucleotide-binding domain-containing protein [Oligoflexia bacterium]|nr:cyclic nucleotide-binding domain-containing protein [Oligoflexia bacterium]
MESLGITAKGPADKNEDALFYDHTLGLFILCDGLSGKGGGDVASRLATEELLNWFEIHKQEIISARESSDKKRREEIRLSLERAIQHLSAKIFINAKENLAHQGMCTTLDVLLNLGSFVLIAHVGSGRIYLRRMNENHQLTDDHTHLAHIRRTGKLDTISAQQIQQYGKRLTRAVGYQEVVKVDYLEIEIQNGDDFFLLTDGVFFGLSDEEVQKLLSTNNEFQEMQNFLLDSVAVRGAKDDYSFILYRPEVAISSDQNTQAEKKIKMLGKVPAFEFLSYQELIKVVGIADLFKVDAGTTICKEGDPGGEMMLVLSGQVNIVKNNQIIRQIGQGDVFGEMSMVDSQPRSASIIAKAQTNLLAFPREALFKLLKSEPSLAVKLLWGVTKEMNLRLRMASNQLVGRPKEEGLNESHSKIVPFEWKR